MGCTASTPEAIASQVIEAQLSKDFKTLRDEIKLLLLGPGESGKSTLFKQMKILARDGGYTEADLLGYKDIIFSNCITQMQILIELCQQAGALLDTEEKKIASSSIVELTGIGESWTPEVGADIQLLWEDPIISNMFKKQKKTSDVRLNESAGYFFGHIERLSAVNYTPTKQDVLRARVRSTGIEEAEFKFDGLRFRMLDVGGQRSERRKWIHCFESVTAVLFCASLSDYDQNLREDLRQNRMKESLLLFDEIVNSPWFRVAPVVLFLNKTDLFSDKITKVDLDVCFPEYTGGKEYAPAIEFIKAKFYGLVMGAKEIFVHETCAIDTRNVDVVFKAVKVMLLKQHLDI